jgi:hypothetical protein
VTNVDALINRNAQQVAAGVRQQKAAWAERALANRQRELRLQLAEWVSIGPS